MNVYVIRLAEGDRSENVAILFSLVEAKTWIQGDIDSFESMEKKGFLDELRISRSDDPLPSGGKGTIWAGSKLDAYAVFITYRLKNGLQMHHRTFYIEDHEVKKSALEILAAQAE